jgi:hypothetical protein
VSRRLRAQPLQSRPSVTVVIPCYNYGCYVRTAVKSVLDQLGVDVEAIVIDDASTDGSAEVVRELAGSDPRVRPILHRRNFGHIATYNEGLEQANGDYVVLLSADDALTPGSLARATALLETHPSVGLVYGHYQTFVDDLPPVTQKVRYWTIWSGDEWIEKRCQRGTCCTMSPEVIIRTSVQHAIGGYDPNLPYLGDFEMFLRAAAVSEIGHLNGPVQADYRVHSDSMMHTTLPQNSLGYHEQTLSSFENVLVGSKASVSNGDALFATARKAMASRALGHSLGAYYRGLSSSAPLEDYMAFAIQVWPGVNKTWRWRLARSAAADDGRVNRGWGATAGRVAVDLRQSVRERRRRWTGQ